MPTKPLGAIAVFVSLLIRSDWGRKASLLLLLLPVLCFIGCAGPGSAAKIMTAIGPPKDPGYVKFKFVGWNTLIEYERDNSVATTNGGITLIPETTFRIK